MAENEKDPNANAPDAAAEAPAPAKKKRKLAILVLPVIGALGGAAATLAVPRPSEMGGSHEARIEQGSFTVSDVKANLSRSGGIHFIAVDIDIRYATRNPEKVAEMLGIKAGGGEGGEGAKPGAPSAPALTGSLGTAVRDRLILLLGSKSVEDLEGREKKEQLKKEVVNELQPILFPEREATIEAVYFGNLLIQ